MLWYQLYPQSKYKQKSNLQLNNVLKQWMLWSGLSASCDGGGDQIVSWITESPHLLLHQQVRLRSLDITRHTMYLHSAKFSAVVVTMDYKTVQWNRAGEFLAPGERWTACNICRVEHEGYQCHCTCSHYCPSSLWVLYLQNSISPY